MYNPNVIQTVSALDIDQGGARICTGGYDYQSKLWDFGGMDAAFKPFKTWECWPEGSYQVNDCKFSNNGDRILIINATLQPKMYSRDGQVLETYTKGDVYIRDMKNTSSVFPVSVSAAYLFDPRFRGHVAEITSCAWHPKDVNTFITASNDSTVRIWDATKRDKQKSVIVVKSKERGQRTHVTATTFTEDGRYIAAAGLDGAVNVWAANSNMVRPNYVRIPRKFSFRHTRTNKTDPLPLNSRWTMRTSRILLCLALHFHWIITRF